MGGVGRQQQDSFAGIARGERRCIRRRDGRFTYAAFSNEERKLRHAAILSAGSRSSLAYAVRNAWRYGSKNDSTESSARLNESSCPQKTISREPSGWIT